MVRPPCHFRMSDIRRGRVGDDVTVRNTVLEASRITSDNSPPSRRAPPNPRRCNFSLGLGSGPTPASRCRSNDHWSQDFGQVAGGRHLWCYLVILFTFVCLFGVGFIFLGAAFVQQAYHMYRARQLLLPLTFCIIGMVSGILMVLGGFVLGRFIISDKWRKNNEPTCPPTTQSSATSVCCPTNNNDPEQETEVQIDLPPPYDATNQPPIFIVTRRNIAVALPLPSAGIPEPPSYADTIGSPPKYTEIDDVTNQCSENTPESATVPSDAVTSRVVMARQPFPSGSRSGRIEVITIVSTRENPPPYDVEWSGQVASPSGTEAPSSENNS